jgi:hypothetical protein
MKPGLRCVLEECLRKSAQKSYISATIKRAASPLVTVHGMGKTTNVRCWPRSGHLPRASIGPPEVANEVAPHRRCARTDGRVRRILPWVLGRN